MTEAMSAEFDTVADWTADAALALGPGTYLAAGCRGSGNPVMLDWFIDELQLSAADRLLDCGAGVGGPAAYAADRVGVRPLLAEPESGACRSARRLFGLPIARCDATALPFADRSFETAWCLGVLCTVPDQLSLLTELHRVLTVGGRAGLLIFEAAVSELPEQPDGNNFPANDLVLDMFARSGFRVMTSMATDDVEAESRQWVAQAESVERELERRHGTDPAWLTAKAQSAIMGRLIGSGSIVPMRFIVEAR